MSYLSIFEKNYSERILKMIRKAFSIYDSKAKVFSNPFFMSEEGEALRDFIDLANDPNTRVFKHPEDFILYKVGTYNDSDATFENTVPPANLGIASAYCKPRQVVPAPPMELVNGSEVVPGGK